MSLVNVHPKKLLSIFRFWFALSSGIMSYFMIVPVTIRGWLTWFLGIIIASYKPIMNNILTPLVLNYLRHLSPQLNVAGVWLAEMRNKETGELAWLAKMNVGYTNGFEEVKIYSHRYRENKFMKQVVCLSQSYSEVKIVFNFSGNNSEFCLNRKEGSTPHEMFCNNHRIDGVSYTVRALKLNIDISELNIKAIHEKYFEN